MTPESPAVAPGLLEWLQGATLMHDDLAKNCLDNNIRCVTLLLRILLDRTDLEVLEVTVQKALPNKFGGHEVRYDIYAKDSTGRLYDIELQLGCRVDELTRRIRFYCSLMDVSHLNPGESYDQLPETWVIFILDRDMFHRNKPLYRIERCVLGEKADDGQGGELLFGDGAHIVVVNGAMDDEDTPLSHLVHDLNCPDPDKMYYQVLADTVRFYKNTEEGVRKMDEYWKGVREEGREEGRKEGLEIGARNTQRSFVLQLLADGVPFAKIAQYTSLSLETIQTLAAEAASARS